MSNVKVKQGCLIEAIQSGEVGVIAHQSNCFNTMGSGVALAIKEAFPEAYKADLKTEKGDVRKLGGFTMASTTSGLIFNLYGQYRYGKDGAVYTQYDHLRSAMQNMAHRLRHYGYLGKIGLPKIGCGTAGGDWEIVSLIIEQTLWEWDVIIYEK